MKSLRTFFSVALIAGLILMGGVGAGCANDDPAVDEPVDTDSVAEVEAETDDPLDSDVPYVPTAQETVERMLELADVSEEDIVYDLGSGDGRIVIAAAEEYGARGVGIEIDSQRVAEARENAEEAGVADRVEFIHGDLFEADISEATVVTLYLLPTVNLKLRPKLFEELRPGTPVVSHDFDMDDWEPEQTIEVGNDTIFLWYIPDEVPEHLRGDE